MFRKIFKREKPHLWVKEAKRKGMSLGAYLTIMELEKKAAEHGFRVLKERENARSRREKWDDHQAELFEREKEKVKGYEEIAKVHSAYISILLNKLGATEDNPIVITPAEVKEVPERFEARATITKDGGYGLYVEDIGHRGECDGVQAEITKFEREEENK